MNSAIKEAEGLLIYIAVMEELTEMLNSIEVKCEIQEPTV